MAWIFLALLAHIANGAVFIVDKSLLVGKSTLGKPLHYALYSAALAGAAIILLPFASIVATPFVLWWAVFAGFVHIVALFIFFTAMRVGEPSRVVPITGSAVPLFTILFAVVFLGEVFTTWQLFGMVLLIVGGGLLSIQRLSTGMFNGKATFPVLAGALFAAYFVITKHIYTYADADFLSVFMATRVVEGVLAVCGIFIWIGVPRPVFKKRSVVKKESMRGSSILFFFNKILAAGAFLLQTYAISLGSVSVVNALQGVQFAVVFLFSLFFSLLFPKFFREDMRRSAIVQKSAGIIILSIGITLIT